MTNYVPACIYCMPGGVIAGGSGLLLWACVQCVMSIVRAQLLPINALLVDFSWWTIVIWFDCFVDVFGQLIILLKTCITACGVRDFADCNRLKSGWRDTPHKQTHNIHKHTHTCLQTHKAKLFSGQRHWMFLLLFCLNLAFMHETK